jgi:hypothetical protein
MRASFLLLPLFPGCLLLAKSDNFLDTASATEVKNTCDYDWDCPDNEACKHHQCKACVDEDCPGGYACSTYLPECNTDCFENSDCREGYWCCDDSYGRDCKGDLLFTCIAD